MAKVRVLHRLAKGSDRPPMDRMSSSTVLMDNLWDRSILRLTLPTNIRRHKVTTPTRPREAIRHRRMLREAHMIPMLRLRLQVKVIVSVIESVPLLMMIPITKTLIHPSPPILVPVPEPTIMTLAPTATVAMITPTPKTSRQLLQLPPP